MTLARSVAAGLGGGLALGGLYSMCLPPLPLAASAQEAGPRVAAVVAAAIGAMAGGLLAAGRGVAPALAGAAVGVLVMELALALGIWVVWFGLLWFAPGVFGTLGALYGSAIGAAVGLANGYVLASTDRQRHQWRVRAAVALIGMLGALAGIVLLDLLGLLEYQYAAPLPKVFPRDAPWLLLLLPLIFGGFWYWYMGTLRRQENTLG